MKKINTLCIIDDDNIFTLVAKKIVNLVGFSENTLLLKNGREALDYFKEEDSKGNTFPEIIFLDLNMPLMGGFDFLKDLEKLKGSANTKVFIFSSSIDPDDQKKAKEFAVVDQFVEKPLTVDKLKMISEKIS
jgi:CheY-like chemotaxis protein